MEGFERALARELGWLPSIQLRRYVRTYGTRSRALLDGAGSIDDLGVCFGADQCQKVVDFLVETEWALSTDDIIWLRTKLGLRLSVKDVERLTNYMTTLEATANGVL